MNYTVDPVFENLSWEIHNDRVVGLIGLNGSGKSTLLHLMAGELTPVNGNITRSSGLTVGILHQDPHLDPAYTVIQEALLASPQLAKIETQLSEIEVGLANPNVYTDEKTLARALDHQARLIEEFTTLGGPNYEGRVRSTLLGLGIKEEEFTLPISALSGGQKKMVGLAKLIVDQPDLLLLDEPDNHLDLKGKTFLEKFIRSYKGAIVIISHDRYLLDIVVDEIAELEHSKIAIFPGNYSEYSFEKQARLHRQQQLYQVQQKEITRLKKSADRLLLWGRVHDNNKFIRRGKNILKRIERIEPIDKPVLEHKRMGLEINGWRGSNKVLELDRLKKSFDGRTILDNLVMELWHGERVGLIGPNGAGKSLLFDIILCNQTPDSGRVKIGPSIEIGYYAQQHETLDYDRSLIDTVRYAAPLTEEAAISFLGKFLFTYEQARGPVKNLSGGERSRVQMALLMLSGANFLLLDEPTNNLDIASAEVLEDALEEFQGSILIISHDRYFLDRVVQRVIDLDEGMLTPYLGGYSDYLAAKLK